MAEKKQRPTQTYDLAYNPRQPRDSHGRWTDTHVGTPGVREGGAFPIAFQQPKLKAKPTSFDALDARPSKGETMHQPISKHVYPKKQWAANRMRAVASMASEKEKPKGPIARPYTPAKVKPKVADIDPAAHLEPWFQPEAQATPKATARGAIFPQVEVGANATQAKSWFDTEVSQEDKEGLSSDLGLDPRLASKSIRELRHTLKEKRTTADEREALKRELAKRAAIAKSASNAAKGWVSNLADKLEGKPDDADLAPIIGETLAAHPKLGPLAHVWDRMRLSGYNFRKTLRKGEFTDELPRIIARNVVTVGLMFLALHFGVEIPGLGGGG